MVRFFPNYIGKLSLYFVFNRQYYGDHQQQGGTLSGEYMRDLFNDFAKQIKTHLPNALISWDISGWIGYGGFSHW